MKDKKLSVFILGFVLTFVMLELLLRLVGIVYINSARPKIEIAKKAKSDYVILCLGDSFTQGTGAPNGYSYPDQLQRLLNRNINRIKFKVLNKGIGSYNSSMILEKTNKYLEKNNPDLVIILAGRANYWNSWGYTKFLRGKTFFARVDDALYGIKLYKLARILIYNIKEKLEYAKSYNGNKPNENKDYFKSYADKYFHLGLINLTNNLVEAKKWFIKAIECNPEGDSRVYAHLAGLALGSDSFEEKNEILMFLHNYKNISNAAQDAIRMLSDEVKFKSSVREWIENDLTGMIQQCKKRNISIVLQNYPEAFDRNQDTKKVNLILERFAHKHSISFVDQQLFFDNLFVNCLVSREDYFVPIDMHCNKRGYGAMAKNLSHVIKSALAGSYAQLYRRSKE
jgi:hypothetical protein